MNKVNVNDDVVITNNSIFQIMGLVRVTGTVIATREGGFSFKCNETGSIETCDYDDGVIV